MNPRQAWKFEHETIESMYRRDVDKVFIGHHAEFLHQYCNLRRNMKEPGEDIHNIRQRIDEIYTIALRMANEWLSREQKKIIDIEVEVGDGVTFCITEEVEDFWIEYSLDFPLMKDNRENLEWVIGDIKRVMEELNIHVPHFALHLEPIWGIGRKGTTCIVDKGKEIIYLCLQVGNDFAIFLYKDIPYDHIYYHELMHAKDVIEGRFPSGGYIRERELYLVTSLWHFSIEGRLQKLGKPCKKKEYVIEDEINLINSFFPEEKIITEEALQELCNELWGKEVTFQELQSIISQAFTGVSH